MERKEAAWSSDDDESDSKREPCLGFDSLPENLRNMVMGYIADNKKDPTNLALRGENRITVCLSQHANLKFGSRWHLGCLSPEKEWQSSIEVVIDAYFLIQDYPSCFDFFRRRYSPYYAYVIDVLVIHLDMSSQTFSSILHHLTYTLSLIQKHLKSVIYVVFAIFKGALCCFSLKYAIDSPPGLGGTVNRSLVLKRILDDLRTIWETNQTFTTKLLLDYYILSDGQPESDIYLSDFVISLSHCRNRDLFDAVDPTLKSSKLYEIVIYTDLLVWLYHFETVDEVNNIDQGLLSRCHAFHLDITRFDDSIASIDGLPPIYCFADNPFITKIVIDTSDYGRPLQLPRPSAPLTVAMPFSALIQLSLKGFNCAFDLTDLNNGHFPHLTHLSIVDGQITGHLDSQHVPCLRTLLLELGDARECPNPEVEKLIHEYAGTLIRADRPWQLVASQSPGGWSLASYDEFASYPENDAKHDLSFFPRFSLPLIKELLLVATCKKNTDEWQLQLNDNHSQKALDGDHKENLLVWSPERVEKITVYCAMGNEPLLLFDKVIPGKTRILKSLTCCGVSAVLDGALLPNLETLKLNLAIVTLSGTFSRLQTLSMNESTLKFPWQVAAPLLETFSCVLLSNVHHLSLRPELLPHLSYLQFVTKGNSSEHCPKILVDGDSLGLSRVKHVVFGGDMKLFAFFNQCGVYHASHLELEVYALALPEGWCNTEWQCETLAIKTCRGFGDNDYVLLNRQVLVLPLLPKVKTLTVTEEHFCCHALLDSEMPNLTDCTVPSPRMFGMNLRCPTLQRICFTEKLSNLEMTECLSRATYLEIGAQPRWIYFKQSGEVYRVLWDAASITASMRAPKRFQGGSIAYFAPRD